MKVLLYIVWGVVLVLVFRYLIDPLWGQLLFVFITAAAVTALSAKMSRRE